MNLVHSSEVAAYAGFGLSPFLFTLGVDKTAEAPSGRLLRFILIKKNIWDYLKFRVAICRYILYNQYTRQEGNVAVKRAGLDFRLVPPILPSKYCPN